MNKYKGTKGKWVVEAFKEPLNMLYGGNFAIYADNDANSRICTLPMSVSNPQSKKLLERQTADANMLAAAPELLERLIESQKVIEAWKKRFVTNETPSPSTEKCIVNNQRVIDMLLKK